MFQFVFLTFCAFWVTANGDFDIEITKRQDTIKVCNDKPIELAIALDESGSVGPGNFNKSLDFLESFLAPFHIGNGLHDMRVALIPFSEGLKEKNGWKLDAYTNKTELLQAVKLVPYSNGQDTDTDLAIDYIRTTLLEPSEVRDHAAKVGIVITDGQANSGRRTVAAANKARTDNITMIAVGVGKKISPLYRQQLQAIGVDHKFITVDSFDALPKITKWLVGETCSTFPCPNKCPNGASRIPLTCNCTCDNANHIVEEASDTCVCPEDFDCPGDVVDPVNCKCLSCPNSCPTFAPRKFASCDCQCPNPNHVVIYEQNSVKCDCKNIDSCSGVLNHSTCKCLTCRFKADVVFAYSPCDLDANATDTMQSIIENIVNAGLAQLGYQFSLLTGNCPKTSGLSLEKFNTSTDLESIFNGFKRSYLPDVLKLLLQPDFPEKNGNRQEAVKMVVAFTNNEQIPSLIRDDLYTLARKRMIIYINMPPRPNTYIHGRYVHALNGENSKEVAEKFITSYCQRQ